MSTISKPNLPIEAMPLISIDKYMAESGFSPATIHRYRKKGWLNVTTISGRTYITREQIAEFNRRATSGEFAGTTQRPCGKRKPANDQ